MLRYYASHVFCAGITNWDASFLPISVPDVPERDCIRGEKGESEYPSKRNDCSTLFSTGELTKNVAVAPINGNT